MKKGIRGQVLVVDLTLGKTHVQELPLEYYKKYLGGRAMGGRLALDARLYEKEPLSPENKVFMMVGPLTGSLIPGVGKTLLVTRSPLTGRYLDSAVGGSLAHNIKMAGYDGLVIQGSSEEPVYLSINNDKVEFKSAEKLRGLGCFAAEKELRKDCDSYTAVATIGPAGENKVRFASLTVDFYHQAGRGGIGAVLGSKNLKALTVRGNLPLEFHEPQALMDYTLGLVSDKIYSKKPQSRVEKGTFSTLDLTQHIGIVPAKNFTLGETDLYDEYNSDSLRKNFVVKELACFGCPMPCGKATKFSRNGEDYILGGPEYESLALLGTNLDMRPEDCCYLSWLCDDMGMDTMSAGIVASCITEAVERGRLGAEEFGIKGWGDVEGVAELIESMASRSGKGDLMAEGVARFAEEYGLEDLAFHVKNMEMPAYDPRGSKGYALGIAVADRGACHRRGRPLYAETQKEGYLLDYEGKAELIIKLEDERGFYHSLSICDFMPPYWGLSVSDYARVVQLVTGFDFAEEDALTLGKRVLTQNRLFNLECGFKREDDTLPERFFKEPLPRGAARGELVERNKFEEMLDAYYELRGWDKDGVPTAETIDFLELRSGEGAE